MKQVAIYNLLLLLFLVFVCDFFGKCIHCVCTENAPRLMMTRVFGESRKANEYITATHTLHAHSENAFIHFARSHWKKLNWRATSVRMYTISMCNCVRRMCMVHATRYINRKLTERYVCLHVCVPHTQIDAYTLHTDGQMAMYSTPTHRYLSLLVKWSDEWKRREKKKKQIQRTHRHIASHSSNNYGLFSH